jgi:predicted nucleic acid-binding protein
MIVVSDTSPITSLIRIARLNLLEQMYRDVLIPPSVHRELIRSHTSLPTWLRLQRLCDSLAVEKLCMELDIGEAEAIVLSKEAGADLLLIDEKLGRKVAIREGLAIAGLLGVLVEAKYQGLIGSVRDVAEALESKAGFRMSTEVNAEAFALAGE